MALNSHNLNSAYSLAKTKDGEWQVGEWINQSLWSIDGKSKRICDYGNMTRWRFFRESREHISDVGLDRGDKVSLLTKRGVREWFYVIDIITSDDGKFHYLVGL